MSKESIERIAREGKKLLDQDAKALWWDEEVNCVLCHGTVPRNKTVLLREGPLQGPACRKHPGVGS